MKKTEILYTRVTKPNIKYVREISTLAKMSRATCLDEMIKLMRENMGTERLAKTLAKRRNQIQEAV